MTLSSPEPLGPAHDVSALDCGVAALDAWLKRRTDRSAQGRGVACGLLKDAVLRVVQAADIVGVRGILVDAIDDAACAFYEKLGFRRSAAFALKLMITLDEVKRAISGGTQP